MTFDLSRVLAKKLTKLICHAKDQRWMPAHHNETFLELLGPDHVFGKFLPSLSESTIIFL
jgi:hypothetical protein